MSGNEVKIRVGLEKPGVDPGLKETDANLTHVGESAAKAGAAAKPAIDSIGVSAKQTAAALRGVPAQFTDIVTALQGGQAPLTVLLQQGGQLKDMFGGIGPAARALGGYMVSLINPVTIAAGTIGALALAYSKGAEEQENFTRTLILSGNIAGTTAGQLADSARRIAEATGSTQSNAAETLNNLVASGKVSTAILEDVGRAAVDLERTGGAAVEQTAKEFESLGDKPVEAVLKLNEKYHFLTAAVFEQIKALADQGKETDAARVAQLAYADAIEGRIPKLKENIGLLEKAWKGVLDTAKGAWDAMLSVGRDDTLEQALVKARDRLEMVSTGPLAATDVGKQAIEAARKAVASLESQIAAQKQLATATSQTVKVEEARIKQSGELAKYLADTSNAPKAAKLAADIEKENKAFSAAVAGLKTTDQGYIDALNAHNERLQQIRENAARGQKDPATSALFNRSDESRRIRKELETELKAIEQVNEKRARAQQIVTNYNDEAAQTLERIARQNELIGVSEREVKVREALYKVEDAATEVRKRITEQIKDETDRSAALAAVDADLANKKLLVAEATRQAYDAARTFDAGWSDALTKYKDNASNAADTARNAFSGMTDAMEGAIKSFVKNGKIDFESFGDAVINTLIDIQMQSLRTNVLAPMMESSGSWLSGLFGGQSDSISLLDGTTFSAKGNVFSGAPGLHQYVNTVQTSPKVFGFNRMHAFANGGVFAEAGPEAVMPLTRDASGRLGVSGSGASVTVNVINNASGTRATQTQRSDGNGNRIIDVMIEQIDAAMADNISRGNGKTPAALESRYGLNRAAGAY